MYCRLPYQVPAILYAPKPSEIIYLALFPKEEKIELTEALTGNALKLIKLAPETNSIL